MVDSTYGWNIISDDLFSSKFMEKLKLYMFATEQHVLDITWNFRQFWFKCIPLLILVYCNSRIVWILTRRIDSNLDNSGNSENKLSRKFLLARTNTIKSFLLVAIFFIICWTCEEIYYLMYNLGYEANWNGNYFNFCLIMVFLNSTVNPFIYLSKYQDYQVALKYLFKTKGESNDISYITC